MADEMELQATSRVVRGKKVRFLRRQGAVPAHIFGHNVDSLTVQCDAAQLQHLLPRVGKTRVINLTVDGAGEPRTVMVREVQRNPVTGELLHVDLQQVSMAEKIKTAVPIVLTGQAPALKEKENMLVQELRNLRVECLPGQIPSSVEIDVSSLTEAHQEIRIRNIHLSEKICVSNEPDVVIARIGILRAEKVEEVVAAAEAAPEAAEGEAAATEEKAEEE